MKRRNVLKGIGLGTLGLVGLHPQIQAAENAENPGLTKPKKKPFKQYGRTPEEEARDAQLFAAQFFTPQEMLTLSILTDIILPRDERSGSATDAGVPDFIEFIAKDMPHFQTPLRGGLRWMDSQSKRRFEVVFAEATPAQRLEIVEDIAYPERKKPGMSQGVAFFSLVRNLTASGFWSSKMGIEDIGYLGNVPNRWEGVPEEVKAQYGLG
jgi:hypothetical protein